MKRLLLASTVLTAALLCGQQASAATGTATSNLAVSALVNTACTISATPLNFGSYSSSAPSDVTGSTVVSATCSGSPTNPVTVTVGGGGGYGAGTYGFRSMQDGASDHLCYGLYTTSGYTPNSDITNGGSANSISLSGGTGSMTIYGAVTKGQTTAPGGSYTDTVLLTATY